MALNESVLLALGVACVGAWIYMLAFRGGFWRADQKPGPASERADWPGVTAIIPARNEVSSIGETISSLLKQDYSGALQVVLVDDESEDGTADMARWAADDCQALDRLTIIRTPPLQSGWTGKLWALHHGVGADAARAADYLWFVDADIVHGPSVLGQLMTKATDDQRDLVSLMVQLRVESFWEKLIVPAFIFFFQMLYPFRAANDPDSSVAAAAGGCMLIRRERLQAIGGINAIRDALIDDCALAARVKASGGRIWLGLGPDSRSLRGADSLWPLWAMVKRTAFTQLSYSASLLLLTVIGLGLVFVTPLLLLAVAIVTGASWLYGAAALPMLAMAVAYHPTLRLYHRNSLEALALPLVATLYLTMTVHSAIDHWRGRGSRWKGRDYRAPQKDDPARA